MADRAGNVDDLTIDLSGRPLEPRDRTF